MDKLEVLAMVVFIITCEVPFNYMYIVRILMMENSPYAIGSTANIRKVNVF